MSWHSYRSKHMHCLAALILNYSSLSCNPKPALPRKGQAVPSSKLFLCNSERNIPQVLLFIAFLSSQNSPIYSTGAPNLQRRIKLTLKLHPSGKNKHWATKIVPFLQNVCVCVLATIPVSSALLLLPCLGAAGTSQPQTQRGRGGGTGNIRAPLGQRTAPRSCLCILHVPLVANLSKVGIQTYIQNYIYTYICATGTPSPPQGGAETLARSTWRFPKSNPTDVRATQ